MRTWFLCDIMEFTGLWLLFSQNLIICTLLSKISNMRVFGESRISCLFVFCLSNMLLETLTLRWGSLSCFEWYLLQLANRRSALPSSFNKKYHFDWFLLRETCRFQQPMPWVWPDVIGEGFPLHVWYQHRDFIIDEFYFHFLTFLQSLISSLRKEPNNWKWRTSQNFHLNDSS